MKLIDADALRMKFIQKMDYCDDILEIIDEMPEAVVRCKDCRYYDRGKNESEEWSECRYYWYVSDFEVNPDCFCSRGERKSDEID